MSKMVGKLRIEALAILLMLCGFALFSICAVCSASQGYSNSAETNGAESYLLIQSLAIVFNGVSFLGCMIWLSKKYMIKVDQMAETTPSMIKTLEALTESIKEQSFSIKEHHQSLEGHGIRLTQIETIHHIRGCNTSTGHVHRSALSGIGDGDAIPPSAHVNGGEL